MYTVHMLWVRCKVSWIPSIGLRGDLTGMIICFLLHPPDHFVTFKTNKRLGLASCIALGGLKNTKKKKKRIQNEKNFGPFLQEHIPWLADGPIVMISPDSFVYKFSCILKFNNGILLYTRHYAAYSPHLQMPDLVTTLRGRQYYPNFSD